MIVNQDLHLHKVHKRQLFLRDVYLLLSLKFLLVLTFIALTASLPSVLQLFKDMYFALTLVFLGIILLVKITSIVLRQKGGITLLNLLCYLLDLAANVLFWTSLYAGSSLQLIRLLFWNLAAICCTLFVVSFLTNIVIQVKIASAYIFGAVIISSAAASCSFQLTFWQVFFCQVFSIMLGILMSSDFKSQSSGVVFDWSLMSPILESILYFTDMLTAGLKIVWRKLCI